MTHVSFSLSSALSKNFWSTVHVTFFIHGINRASLLLLSGSCLLRTVHQTVGTCNWSIPPMPFPHFDLSLGNTPAAVRVEIGLRSVIFSWHWRRVCGLRNSRRSFLLLLLCRLKHNSSGRGIVHSLCLEQSFSEPQFCCIPMIHDHWLGKVIVYLIINLVHLINIANVFHSSRFSKIMLIVFLPLFLFSSFLIENTDEFCYFIVYCGVYFYPLKGCIFFN
jgi:hypothetical protein